MKLLKYLAIFAIAAAQEDDRGAKGAQRTS